ncbi:hypothetical protein MDMS009_2896 [Methylophaga thiooxydans DMS010]|uniref:Uncharacterized protein n=1 Tax=Methylophaga thiooxydans DMS010 TaxID=637616 RepID=C0N9N8_9GAMM|nr:hypothetical protein MDMS009_2896 [Methylophaga thiooxydans DMS010]
MALSPCRDGNTAMAIFRPIKRKMAVSDETAINQKSGIL